MCYLIGGCSTSTAVCVDAKERQHQPRQTVLPSIRRCPARLCYNSHRRHPRIRGRNGNAWKSCCIIFTGIDIRSGIESYSYELILYHTENIRRKRTRKRWCTCAVWALTSHKPQGTLTEAWEKDTKQPGLRGGWVGDVTAVSALTRIMGAVFCRVVRSRSMTTSRTAARPPYIGVWYMRPHLLPMFFVHPLRHHAHIFYANCPSRMENQYVRTMVSSGYIRAAIEPLPI